MKPHWCMLVLASVVLAVLNCRSAAAEPGDSKVNQHVYELRVYYVLPGRMDALKARFRDHTNKLSL